MFLKVKKKNIFGGCYHEVTTWICPRINERVAAAVLGDGAAQASSSLVLGLFPYTCKDTSALPWCLSKY